MKRANSCPSLHQKSGNEAVITASFGDRVPSAMSNNNHDNALPPTPTTASSSSTATSSPAASDSTLFVAASSSTGTASAASVKLESSPVERSAAGQHCRPEPATSGDPLLSLLAPCAASGSKAGGRPNRPGYRTLPGTVSDDRRLNVASSRQNAGPKVSEAGSPRYRSKGHGIRFVISRAASHLTSREIEDRAVIRLRKMMLNCNSHRFIPDAIADWPAVTLRLSQILSPETCTKMFACLDDLWSCVLHGLLIQKPTSRLRCLDFSGFVPTRALLCTTLQLIPLLSCEGNLDKDVIIKKILHKHATIHGSNLMKNLNKLLDILMTHPVFKRGRKLVHKEPFRIVIDHFPLSAESLAFYGWLISSSISDVSNVYIIIRSITFNYNVPGPDIHPVDPEQLLQMFAESSHMQNVQSLSVVEIPVEHMTGVAFLLKGFVQKAKNLTKLVIAGINMTGPSLTGVLSSLISECTMLTSLDMSGSRIDKRLVTILESVPLGLEFLSLSHAHLQDIEAIFDSKHKSTLLELDISDICCSEHDDECSHGPDKRIFRAAFRSLHKLERVRTVKMTTGSFGTDRLDSDCFSDLICCLRSLSLWELEMEKIPLWDEDIQSIVRVLSKMSFMRRVTMTRSSSAPRLTAEDTSAFWKRIEQAKNGRNFVVSVRNVLVGS